jgi:hypothetical protein
LGPGYKIIFHWLIWNSSPMGIRIHIRDLNLPLNSRIPFFAWCQDCDAFSSVIYNLYGSKALESCCYVTMTITADLKDCSYKNIRSKSREKLKLDCSICVVAKFASCWKSQISWWKYWTIPLLFHWESIWVIYTLVHNINIIFTWVHNTNTEKSWLLSCMF